VTHFAFIRHNSALAVFLLFPAGHKVLSIILSKMGPKLISPWKRFQKMNWASPSFAMPHGYSGLASLCCGVYLLYTSIGKNTLAPFGTHLPFQYVFFTVWNAVGGYRIAYKAPVATRRVFQACAIFQFVTCYYVLRFLPNFYTRVPSQVLRFLDCAMVLPFLGVGFSFLGAAYDIRKESPAASVAVVVGTMASSLTFCYPLHLVQNAAWLDCIVTQRYPAEDITLTAYVYLPATLCFSVMIFGATLYQRHIISDSFLGLMGMVCCIGVVFTGVFIQEIQLPIVSGQHIYMPCPAPMEGTWSYQMERFTNPRESLQTLLSYPWVASIVRWMGTVSITDHTSYRPVS
jgi:hypothetical protein